MLRASKKHAILRKPTKCVTGGKRRDSTLMQSSILIDLDTFIATDWFSHAQPDDCTRFSFAIGETSHVSLLTYTTAVVLSYRDKPPPTSILPRVYRIKLLVCAYSITARL